MIRKRTGFSLLALLGLSLPLAAADVMVVYDASNSMWGQIDGRHKIEIAREVMTDVMGKWDEGTQVGLVAYGHRREADCSDIETVIPVGPLEPASFIETINNIMPRGKTPLTAAVRHAAEVLNYRDRPATVVLISDGIESCNADPCVSAEELERAGIRFTAHVIGFDIGDEAEQAGLKCIADNTGGQFFAAGDADSLAEALGEASRLVAEPDPEVAAPEILILAPETATIGSEIEISWEGETEPRDLITVVDPATPDDELGRYERIQDNESIRLLMPGDTGTWQLRYRHQDSGEIAARAEIDLLEASPELIAPESVTAGAQLDFSWQGAIHPRDYIMIVPAGAGPDTRGEYLRVGNAESGSLTAPGEPGDYELRYHLNSDKQVLARAEIRVVEAGVDLSGPAEVGAGERFEFEWSDSIHPRDFITIVPADADENTWGDYIRVGGNNSGALVAPGQAGDYELRYHLNEDKRVLARVTIDVVESSVELLAPGEVGAGERIEFEWSASIHPRDYITVVQAGADADARGDYIRVGNNTAGGLVVPGEPGEYELRYHLNENGRLMASHPFRVIAQEVTIDAPDQVTAGASFSLQWSNPVHPRDYVTIVPVGTPDDEHGPYKRVGSATSTSLVAPGESGDYEVRYHLNVDDRVLTRKRLSSVASEVSLDSPEAVVAGSNFEVRWSGGIHPRDYVTIVPIGTPDDEHGPYKRVGNGNSATLQMPGATGDYELRYHLNVDDRIMASRPVQATAPQVTLEAPDQAAPGETLTIEHSGGVHPRDYITIVAADAPEDAYQSYKRVGGGDRVNLNAPEEPGRYQIRYLLEVNDHVMARRELLIE